MGIGYTSTLPGAFEASQQTTRCECGYSVVDYTIADLVGVVIAQVEHHEIGGQE